MLPKSWLTHLSKKWGELQTFIRAYANLDQLRDPARFAAWLRRVTFGVAMSWLRTFRNDLFKRLEGRVDVDSLDIPDFKPGPAEVAQNRDLARAVLGAIDSLPAKYRVPLTMFHLDGLSYQKVADFLDIPLGTVKTLIRRARKKLEAALAAYATQEITPMVQEVFNEHKLADDFASKVIQGLEKVRWGAGEAENSVMGALAAAMKAIGEDVSYEFLMGVSGAAFRLQIHASGGCNAPAPHAGIGFNCIQPALNALAYELIHHDTSSHAGGAQQAPQGGAEQARKVREAIVDSIDRGVPVMYGSEEESLIVGYSNGGKEFLLRPYAARDEGYKTMRRWPWGVRILRKKGEPPPRRQSILNSLETALELADAEDCEGYAIGFRAYKVWISELLDESRFKGQDANWTHAKMVGNGHCYYSLLDARGSAAIYLKALAHEFEEAVSRHLLKAADLYQRIADVLTKRCPTEIAPMPWMLKEGEVWTQEMRAYQAGLLSEAEEIEHEALGEIRKALELIRR